MLKSNLYKEITPCVNQGVENMACYRLQYNKVLEIKKLPTLPQIAYRLLHILCQKDPDLNELEKIIRYDQSISAKVLSVANSAYFGFQKEIDTIHRAIIALGARQVGEIAFSVCVLSTFRPLKSIQGFNLRDFWLHCIITGIIARILAPALECQNEEKFFTLGLLHDIGRLVLIYLFPKEFEEILINQKISGKSLLVEEKKFGLAHTWLGRWLLYRWGLPDIFAQVARFHHNPFHNGKFLFEPAVIKLADIIAHQLETDSLPTSPSEEVDPLLEKLNLSKVVYRTIIEHLEVIQKDMKNAWDTLL